MELNEHTWEGLSSQMFTSAWECSFTEKQTNKCDFVVEVTPELPLKCKSLSKHSQEKADNSLYNNQSALICLIVGGNPAWNFLSNNS